jgi:hypothetical protein
MKFRPEKYVALAANCASEEANKIARQFVALYFLSRVDLEIPSIVVHLQYGYGITSR